MSIGDWWARLRGRIAPRQAQESARAEETLDRQRQQYEAEQQQRGRMGPGQGAGNVGF
ncbi:MAG: hypothetical protein IPL41_10725 [Micropruina sp.]|nr:hypothetical protein [Micropruina sp.]